MSNIISDIKIPGVIEELERMHPEASCALDFGTRFQLLVSVVLSAQTTDISVNKVTPELFSKYPTAEAMAEADVSLAKMLTEKYGGEVPGTFDKLVKLPGVGRKTANVVLAEGFGENRIAVDTHVFRVANRIGLADGKDPVEVEETLMARLPEDQWTRAHHLLIFHGRKVCHARKPDCVNCGLKDICKYEEKSVL